MKRTAILVSLIVSALVLCACGGNNRENDSERTPEERQISENGLAWKINSLMPREKLNEHFRDFNYEKAGTTHFGDIVRDEDMGMESGSAHIFSIDCFKREDGSWLAFYIANTNTWSGAGSLFRTDFTHAMTYDGDSLSFIDFELPHPNCSELLLNDMQPGTLTLLENTNQKSLHIYKFNGRNELMVTALSESEDMGMLKYRFENGKFVQTTPEAVERNIMDFMQEEEQSRK